MGYDIEKATFISAGLHEHSVSAPNHAAESVLNNSDAAALMEKAKKVEFPLNLLRVYWQKCVTIT